MFMYFFCKERKKFKKKKIKIVCFGEIHTKVNLKKIINYKSQLFEFSDDDESKITRTSLPNVENGHDYVTYEDNVIENILPSDFDADFLLAISDVVLANNFYARPLTKCRAILSFNGIKRYLEEEHIPLENEVLRIIYENVLGFDFEHNNSNMPAILHDEIRKCIFDMNGDISTIVCSCNKPIICEKCRVELAKKDIPSNIIEIARKELKKLRKSIFYEIADFIKQHPIVSIIISSVYVIVLDIVSFFVTKYLL